MAHYAPWNSVKFNWKLKALKVLEILDSFVNPEFQERNMTVTGFWLSATLFCQKENVFKL